MGTNDLMYCTLLVQWFSNTSFYHSRMGPRTGCRFAHALLRSNAWCLYSVAAFSPRPILASILYAPDESKIEIFHLRMTAAILFRNVALCFSPPTKYTDHVEYAGMVLMII